LSKSAGREYREKVKCVFLKKNDVCINIGFWRDGLLLIRVHVYWWMSFWSQNLCHCIVYRKRWDWQQQLSGWNTHSMIVIVLWVQ
jgi:hypothetical protein